MRSTQEVYVRFKSGPQMSYQKEKKKVQFPEFSGLRKVRYRTADLNFTISQGAGGVE